MFGWNKLRKAIQKGLARGELAEELREIGDVSVRSRRDGETICWGLRQLSEGDTAGLSEQVYALAGLFQDVGGRDCPAFAVLEAVGIPLLVELYDKLLNEQEQDENALLFVLKILALYGTTEGHRRVVSAARMPLFPGAYLWSVVLGAFESDHPGSRSVFEALSTPLPPGFIAVSLLDAANAARIAGAEMPHPFDSDEGVAQIEAWLTSDDPDQVSYAHSATAALPFLSVERRDTLLKIALAHQTVDIRLEAAWAAAKLGLESGRQQLAFYARNYRYADRALQYMEELGLHRLIPEESTQPDFRALSEFASWLAHPSELGRPPDELEIVDQRDLSWPLSDGPTRFYLIRYTAKAESALEYDDIDCGLVGSTTFCLFSYRMAERPPEDAYAIHAFWEMQGEGLIDEIEVHDLAPLMAQWPGPSFHGGELVEAVAIDPALEYSQSTVALIAGVRDGEDCGWAVIDGSRSRWYSQAEMPEEAPAQVVLKVHVGRGLLGFDADPDRAAYLAAPRRPKPPTEFAEAYENLLEGAKSLPPAQREAVLDSFGPAGTHLDEYAEALVQLDRAPDIRGALTVLEPHWDHNSGYGQLGRVAHRCGQTDIAERLFLKLRASYPDHHRGEEMGLLAEIQCANGRNDEAKALLLECLSKLLEESKTATGSDRKLFEQWFQERRSKFLELFPGDAGAAMSSAGIPSSTLQT